MKIVPKINSKTNFYLFTDSGQEYEFKVIDKQVYFDKNLTPKQLDFIDKTFKTKTKPTIDKDKLIVELYGRGVSKAIIRDSLKVGAKRIDIALGQNGFN